MNLSLLNLAGNSRTGRAAMSGKKLDQVWSRKNFARYVRKHFPQSAELHLSNGTGIPATTCKKHVYGETKPSADHVMAYLGLFGPELLCAVMGANAPAWAARLARDEKRRELENQAAAIAKRLAEYSA